MTSGRPAPLAAQPRNMSSTVRQPPALSLNAGTISGGRHEPFRRPCLSRPGPGRDHARGCATALGATMRAALAQPWPHPVPSHQHPPAHFQTIVIGGMRGWQVALIAVAAAVVAACAVIVD